MSHHASPTGSLYTYQRLTLPNAIRLIYFPKITEPDQWLSCELKEVSLDAKPPFQALSYTWGEAIFPCSLTCGDKAIRITQNLYDALVQLRNSGEELQIWIDAICIDQSNADEKSQQIPLMAEIYGMASSVLIWLGVESQGSVEAMQYLSRIGNGFLNRGGSVREPKVEQSGDHGSENKALWETVYQDNEVMQQTDVIWGRSWFSRRWIIQEIAFAKNATVHCGGEQLAWEVLAKAAEVLAILEGDGSQFINRRSGEANGAVCVQLHNATKLERIRQELQASDLDRTERKLLHCLDDARGFECRDEKDYLFALLGIINHCRDDPFTIEYTRPTAEVFTAFAKYCFSDGKSLELLSSAGLSNHVLCGKSLELPSWVPDWRLPFRSPSDRLSGFDSQNPFDVASESESRFGLHESTMELSIRGILVGRIIAACPSIGIMEDIALEKGKKKWTLFDPSYIVLWYQSLEGLFRSAFELIKVDVSVADYVTGGESAWEALGRTLVLDSNEVSFDMKAHPNSLIQKSDVPDEFPQPKLTDEFFVFRKRMFTTYGTFPSTVVRKDNKGRPVDSPPEPEHSVLLQRHNVTKSEGISYVTYSEGTSQVKEVVDFEYLEYFTRLIDRCQNRSFFVSAEGYIGLGPKETRHGDLICFLEGMHTPCIVRVHRPNMSQSEDEDINESDEVGDGKVKLELIGECYAHGLMFEKDLAACDEDIIELTLI